VERSIVVDGALVTPSKILCVGRNYVEHIHELGNEIPAQMVRFIKPNSAIGNTLYAVNQEPLHYEGELCFVYSNEGFGAVGFGLDLTRRSLQATLKAKGLPWERAKAFDGSALFSPFVSFPTLDNLHFTLHINQQPVQLGKPDLMIYPPSVILAEIRRDFSLQAGDIVMTGTPRGVGKVCRGDLFEGKVFAEHQPLTAASWRAR